MSMITPLASCKIDGGDGGTAASFLTNSNAFLTVLREALGTVLVTMAPGFLLEDSDVVAIQRDLGIGTFSQSVFSAVERVSSSQFRVRYGTNNATLEDGVFFVTISRVLRG